MNWPRKQHRFIIFSALTRMIFLANFLGLVVLIIGALVLNQFSSGLIIAKVDSLKSQTKLITNLIGDQATGFGVVAVLDEDAARQIMRRIDVPTKARVRLYDKNGALVADSDLFDDSVEVGQLDPIVPIAVPIAEKPKVPLSIKLQNWVDEKVNNLPVFKRHRARLQRHLGQDIKNALRGETIAGESYAGKNLLVAVVMPVKRVQDVQGVVVYETHDVADILASQRRGLSPIIVTAILASVLSSLALTLFIALPIRRLAHAAEQVRRSSDKRGIIPNLSSRHDEIGDLSLVLRDMTEGLYSRIDDIANFAADVAHEIKNPLTSLRSASETLRIAKTKEQRAKMIDIIEKDVVRMDRLITDISKASRMDAALAKESLQPIDAGVFLADMVDFYKQTMRKTGVDVVLTPPKTDRPIIIGALENSLGQVIRNLVDNALTVSPKDSNAQVRLTVALDDEAEKNPVIITVEDDGPGIPVSSLETVFDRFYTQRPAGAAFGDHSGLGLAICRQIMIAHHGSIEASNHKDDKDKVIGARFIVRMPEHSAHKKKKHGK
ncbi:MAG: stimulus-sensing domain-containing protein [Robiginitomaculum sp.]